MAETASEEPGALVLVVDDEAVVRDTVCAILDDIGLRTVTASDGSGVVRLAVRDQPALIVLDVMMPGMDGYTTLTRLRGHPLTSAIPVIILTGQDPTVYRELSQGVGAIAHISKPFASRDLIDAVRRALDECGA